MGNETACYCRVSTKKEEQALSLENQVKFFEDFAEKSGLQGFKLYADKGISAKSMKKRDDFNRMVADAKRGLIRRILVKDISRFARNTYDFLGVIRELKAIGVVVQFVTYNMDTTDSEFTLTILAAVAQEESAALSRRVKFGKQEGAKNGRVPSRVYGYKKIKGNKYALSIIPHEAETVKRIFELYTDKQMSTYQIAALLNKEAVPTKQGEPYKWSQTVISGILRNRLYIGKVCNNKSETTDFITGDREKFAESAWIVVERPEYRIVSNEIWEKANAIRESRINTFHQFQCDGKVKYKRPSVKYPMSNLLVCANDNYAFRRRHRVYKSGNEYKYWTCSKRDLGASICNNKIKVDEGQILDAVIKFLSSLFDNQADIRKQFKDKAGKELSRKYARDIDVKALKDEHSKLSQEREKYMALYIDDLIDKNYLSQKIMQIEGRLKEIINSLSIYNNRDKIAVDIDKCLVKMTQKINENKNDWLDNAFLKSIFEKFLIYPEGRIEAVLKLASDTGTSITIPFCEISNEA